MTRLVVSAEDILADLAARALTPEQTYAHRRIVGTCYGSNWHYANGTPVCDPCRDAKRAYRRDRDVSPEFLRLVTAGVNRRTADYLARHARRRRAKYRELSTPVREGVHCAAVRQVA